MSWAAASRVVAVTAVVALLVATGPAPSMAEESAALTLVTAAADIPDIPPGQYEVTLLTGDRVTVTRHPGGQVAVDAAPADRPGGAGVEFEWVDAGDAFYVLPSDVRALAGDQLDLALFDVLELVRSGYHAAGTGYLPVIVTFPDAPRAAAAPALPAATPLPSIDGAAAALDPAAAQRFWRDVQAGPATAARQRELAGIEKIWLDRRVEADLHDSVELVGAPAAWDAGFDGTGVTIAVLDTGIDADHPDLAGEVVAARNFTPDPSPADGHGHGTHVAATAAGTGAGSAGDRTGVAPGADLVNGKVLDNGGSGLNSWIIAGMEWAAGQAGADVVSMSLGGGVTDGTDPLSQAVDRITEQTGTLFVIAAGNLGTAGVSSPGSASSALTVGSVSKSEQLAGSSGRGPRRGDFAIKPDLTAPGVDIVAARAAGTSLGSPVDDFYTSASGTSMATPHVAGAAAILAQQHPDWDWAQLKSALASTGVPRTGLTVFQQGGGRLDLAAATGTSVLAAPAPLDLGYFPYPHDDAEPVSKPVTYTNLTDQEVSLTLSMQVRDEQGAPPAAGLLALDRDSLTIPPGGTGTGTLTVDVAAGEFGQYGGYLVADQKDAPTVRTPVGFVKESERYGLTVRGIDTEGGPATGALTVMNVADRNEFFELNVNYDPAGVAHVRVPPGTYAVYGFADTHPAGEVFATVRTAVAEPEIEVQADVEVVFDARTAVPINVDTPAHDVVPRIRTTVNLHREPEVGPGATRGVQAFADGTVFQALPTDPVQRGFFELDSRWQLADLADPIGTAVLYDVVFPETGSIPSTLDYVVHPDQLATSHQEFYAHVADSPEQTVQEVRHWWRPWQTGSLGIFEDVPAPGVRTDYLATVDTSWTRSLWFAGPPVSSLVARMNAPRMEYQPGAVETRTWMRQPVKPGLIEGSPWHSSIPVVRDGDVLDLLIAGFSDSQRGHWSHQHASIDQAQFRLYEDGELVAEADRPSGQFPLSPEPSRVRMELDVARDAPWWTMSTRTSTAWEFGTAPAPGGGAGIVPMLLVDYDVAVDLLNTALPVGNTPPFVGLQVRHQPGADGPPVAGARLWVSYDDGDSWLERPVRPLGEGEFQAVLPFRPPAGADFASLRVEAWDTDGNRIEQEITRAVTTG
ncbi:MAG: S8 family serine peptidase [Micromonosporaceae bacterium]|nr:S8 family serine peptidase [Micromonosporaceae bacterium]